VLDKYIKKYSLLTAISVSVRVIYTCIIVVTRLLYYVTVRVCDLLDILSMRSKYKITSENFLTRIN
jgi:hypothetical protein